MGHDPVVPAGPSRVYSPFVGRPVRRPFRVFPNQSINRQIEGA
jgi:hypothetical protein